MAGAKIEKPNAFWVNPNILKPVLENIVLFLAEAAPSNVREEAQKWPETIASKLSSMTSPNFQTSLLALHQYLRNSTEQSPQMDEKDLLAVKKLLLPKSQTNTVSEDDKKQMQTQLMHYQQRAQAGDANKKVTYNDMMVFILEDQLFGDLLQQYSQHYTYKKPDEADKKHNELVQKTIEATRQVLAFATTPADVLKSDYEHYMGADGRSLMTAPATYIKQITALFDSIAKEFINLKTEKRSKTAPKLSEMHGLIAFHLANVTTQFNNNAKIAHISNDPILQKASQQERLMNGWTDEQLNRSIPQSQQFIQAIEPLIKKMNPTVAEEQLVKVREILARYDNAAGNDAQSQREQAIQEAQKELERLITLGGENASVQDSEVSEALKKAEHALLSSKFTLTEMKSMQEIKEFFTNESVFSKNMTIFRNSLFAFNERISGDKRFTSEDRAVLNEYSEALDLMLKTQDRLPFFDLIKDPKNTADAVLAGINTIYKSEDFVNYSTLLNKLIAAEDHFKAVLNKNGAQDPSLSVFTEAPEKFTIRPVQHSPRYPLQFKAIKDTIAKILKLSKELNVPSSLYSESSLTAVEQVLDSAKAATDKVNLFRSIKDSTMAAKEEMAQAGKEKKSVALRTMLGLYINSPLYDTSPDARMPVKYYNTYVPILLGEAFSNYFKLVDDRLTVAAGSSSALIAEALGFQGNSSPYTFDPAQFKGDKLSSLFKKTKDPVWLVLKSMCSTSNQFTIHQKIDLCTQIAGEFNQGKIGATNKYQGAVTAATLAYATAGSDAKALDQARNAFAPKLEAVSPEGIKALCKKNQFGNWIVAKQVENEHFESIPGNTEQGMLYHQLVVQKRINQTAPAEQQNVVLKAIMTLNLNTPAQPKSSEITYLETYLKTLLVSGFPDVFYVHHQNGELMVNPSDRRVTDIYKALGIHGVAYNVDKAVVGKYTIDSSRFNAAELDKLYAEDHNSLWLVLKSTKPIDATFTAQQKVESYIQLAAACYDGQLGKKDPHLLVRELARVAYTIAAQHPATVPTVLDAFAPKKEQSFDSQKAEKQREQLRFGDWLVSHYKGEEQQQLIGQLSAITDKNALNKEAVTQAKERLQAHPEAKNKQATALRELLQLHHNSPKQDSASVKVELKTDYIKTLLVEAFPEYFHLLNGELAANAGNYSSKIPEAFGHSTAAQPLDFSTFKPSALDELYKDSQNPVWLVLKSMMPTQEGFSDKDKVTTYIQLAEAFHEGQIGATGKYTGALDLARVAFSVAKENPTTVALVRDAFSPNSKFGSWIIGKHKSEEDKQKLHAELQFKSFEPASKTVVDESQNSHTRNDSQDSEHSSLTSSSLEENRHTPSIDESHSRATSDIIDSLVMDESLEKSETQLETVSAVVEKPAPSEFEVTAQEHEAEVQQPVAEVQQPVAEVQQPVAEVQQPVAEVQQPVVEVQQPVVEVQQPVAETQQPVAEAQQPVAEAQQPVAEVQQPIVEVEQPIVEVEQPIVEVQQPIVEVEQPIVEVQQPIVEVQQPVVEVQQPVAEVQQPVAEVQQPVAEVQQPVVMAQEPAAVAQEPELVIPSEAEVAAQKEAQAAKQAMEATIAQLSKKVGENTKAVQWCKQQLTNSNQMAQSKQKMEQLNKIIDIVLTVTATLEKSSSWGWGYNNKGITKAASIKQALLDAEPEQLLTIIKGDIKAVNGKGDEQFPGLSALFKGLAEQRAILFKSKEAKSLTFFKDQVKQLQQEESTTQYTKR